MYPRSRPSVIKASTFVWSFPFAFPDCAFPLTRPEVALVILTLRAGTRLIFRTFFSAVFFFATCFLRARFALRRVGRFFAFSRRRRVRLWRIILLFFFFAIQWFCLR